MAQRRTKPARQELRRVGNRIHAELAAGIGARILDGTYPPGTLLPNEAEWCRMFGASRTAVREAIKTLNGKGLLVSRPKIGSRVEPRDRWSLLDRDVMAWHCAAMDKTAFLISLQEVRRILEPGTAVLAARRRTPEQLTQLEEALESMRGAVDAEAMVGPDVRFHLALLACANNELLAPFGTVIEQALANLFAFTSRHNSKPLMVIPLHKAVVDAVARRDSAGALQAVTALLEDTDNVIATAPHADTLLARNL
jgi:DNA-binding FadR family transcriptional regulator